MGCGIVIESWLSERMRITKHADDGIRSQDCRRAYAEDEQYSRYV